MTKPILTAEEYEKINSIDELLENLQKKGADVRSKKQAYKFAKQEWWDLNRRKTYASNNGLPGESVTVNGITYHIHGIAHGLSGVKPELKEYLRAEVKRFLDAGCAVYTEQGLSSGFFEGLNVNDMNDASLALRENPESMKYIRNVGLLVPLAFLSYGTNALISKISNNPKGKEREYKDVLIRACSDKDSLADLQNAVKSYCLPELLECDWLKKNNPSTYFIRNVRSKVMADVLLDHEHVLKASYERSKMDADEFYTGVPTSIIEQIVHEKMEKLKKMTEAKEIHVIVGAAHQQGILYYLKKKDLEAQ